MKRYFAIYWTLTKMNMFALLIYRGNFLNSLLSSLSWGIFLFITMFLLTSRSSSLYGWKPYELLLATCGYSIMVGIFHTLFSRNFERMSSRIRYGEVDGFLGKPLDTQFILSMEQVNFTSIIRIILGFVLGWYYIATYHISVTFLQGIAFFALLGFGIILLYSLWFLMITSLIYFPRMHNIVDLMYSITGMVRYPKEMYQQFGSFVSFLFLPFMLILFTPVRGFFARVNTEEIILLLLLSVGFLFLSRVFWKFSLKHYTSTGG